MFQPPVGSAVLLTAVSRWFTVVNAPVVGTTSRVSTTTKNRWVWASNRHDGSVTNWPRTPVVRLIAAWYPKKVFRSTAWFTFRGKPETMLVAVLSGSADAPFASNTLSTSLTASSSNPLPTHSPWSGGSTENWLPLFEYRCW